MISTQSGPFNLAYTQDYSIQGGRATRELNASGGFAVLTIFRDSILHSEDAIAYLCQRAHLDEELKQNCVAQAIVAAPTVRGLDAMRPVIDRFFKSRGMGPERGRFFGDEIAARAWIQPIAAALMLPAQEVVS